jgi:DNA-binding XRE family transcriptional regulator
MRFTPYAIQAIIKVQSEAEGSTMAKHAEGVSLQTAYRLLIGKAEVAHADLMPLASLKDLRKSARQTQEDLAAALGVGQDTISRLEKRSDMLLSTLRHYVESVGGHLTLVASFPNQPPVIIDHLGDKKKRSAKKQRRSRLAGGQSEALLSRNEP